MSALPHAVHPDPGFRLSRGRERGGILAVTVATAKLLLVRRALVQSREPIGIVKATPLAGGTRVRLLVAVPHGAADRVMRCIQAALAPAGEAPDPS